MSPASAAAIATLADDFDLPGDPADLRGDPAIDRVTCNTCGGSGRLGTRTPCGSCGGKGTCLPGRKPADVYNVHTACGRFLADLYQTLRYPDPCYQPVWLPEANAGFFLDYAKPQTVTRFRYEYFNNLQTPDRAEYFWAREGGRGPKLPTILRRNGSSVTAKGISALTVNQILYYTEVATPSASFFVEIPYRSLDVSPYISNTKATRGDLRHAAGFADMNLGTKALLFDRELVQLTFQFRTYLPIGAANSGLGNGHVSLEPSLLSTVKIGPETYLQGQLAEWIPLGGDTNYQGAAISYRGSLNHVFYRFNQDSPLIGTFEFGGMTFQDGLVSDPVLGPIKTSGVSYFNLGPGVRMSFDKRIDVGAGVVFPTTNRFLGDPQVRAELRIVF